MLNTEQIRENLLSLGFIDELKKDGGFRKYVYQFTHPKIKKLTPRISRQSERLDDNLVMPYTYEEQAKSYSLDRDGFACTNRRSRSSGYSGYPNDNPNQEPPALYFQIKDLKGLTNFIRTFYLEIFQDEPVILLDDAEPEREETEREAIVKARIGHTTYRNKLINYWEGCAVTGCTKLSMLVASHIKPWRVTKDRAEHCLNVNNGLLLTANLDKAFDQGLISFNELGNILINPSLSKNDCLLLGISSDMKLRKSLNDKQKEYLKWHISQYFQN